MVQQQTPKPRYSTTLTRLDVDEGLPTGWAMTYAADIAERVLFDAGLNATGWVYAAEVNEESCEVTITVAKRGEPDGYQRRFVPEEYDSISKWGKLVALWVKGVTSEEQILSDMMSEAGVPGWADTTERIPNPWFVTSRVQPAVEGNRLVKNVSETMVSDTIYGVNSLTDMGGVWLRGE
jgi:hypothetical protein